MSLRVNLFEAIFEIEKWHIGKDEMVILARPGMLRSLIFSELVDSGLGDMFCYNLPGKPSRFMGILVIEDQVIPRIIVKSLISDHRVEIKE